MEIMCIFHGRYQNRETLRLWFYLLRVAFKWDSESSSSRKAHLVCSRFTSKLFLSLSRHCREDFILCRLLDMFVLCLQKHRFLKQSFLSRRLQTVRPVEKKLQLYRAQGSFGMCLAAPCCCQPFASMCWLNKSEFWHIWAFYWQQLRISIP